MSPHVSDPSPTLRISRRGMLGRLPAWLAAGCLALMTAGPASAENPYSYAKFSLEVPWTLYFVFLTLVSVPFAVMILLAWQRGRGEEEPQQPDTTSQQGSHRSLTKNERS